MTEEMIDIVDEDDNVLEVMQRHKAHHLNVIRRVVIILVFNRKGKLFVSKRAPNKKVFPNMWDLGSGGGVQAQETYEHAAARELEEEMGIKGEKIEYLFNFKYRSQLHSYNSKIYRCIYDGKIWSEHEEFLQGGFREIKEIKKMIDDGLFCPDNALLFKRWTEWKEGNTKLIYQDNQ